MSNAGSSMAVALSTGQGPLYRRALEMGGRTTKCQRSEPKRTTGAWYVYAAAKGITLIVCRGYETVYVKRVV